MLTIASSLALGFGSMTQAAVAAPNHFWRRTMLRHQDPVQAGASMRGLPRGHMIQIAEAAPKRELPTGLAQPVPATASMLVWQFGTTTLTARLANLCFCPKTPREIAQVTANMSPRVLGSMMPTAVVALLPSCRKQRNLRVNARTTASMNPKQRGSMMPTVVGALQHWLKAVLLQLIKDV